MNSMARARWTEGVVSAQRIVMGVVVFAVFTALGFATVCMMVVLR